MVKRTGIVILGVLVLAWALSACVGGDLAEDLTPIPTLSAGEEPELVDALQVTPEPAAAETDGEALSQEELVALGEQAFGQCAGCHGAQAGAGPSLPSMGANAASRVEGMSAEDYLYESIVEPGAYIVEGYSNIMPANYEESLSEQQIQGLVAYMLAEAGESDVVPADDETEDEGEPTAEETETPEPEPTEDEETENGDVEDAAAAVEGDAANGETLFALACVACHGAETGVGPSLPTMAENAGERVEGQSAEDYLYESIVDPGAYIVEGFNNIMPATYEEQYSDQEIWDIVAYILAQ